MAIKGAFIDGNHRKKIANELGYDCPEIVQAGLDADEKRTLARALNLARRQLNSEQKRELISDQLKETPERSSRWIGKMLGVHQPDTRLPTKGFVLLTGRSTPSTQR